VGNKRSGSVRGVEAGGTKEFLSRLRCFPAYQTCAKTGKAETRQTTSGESPMSLQSRAADAPFCPITSAQLGVEPCGGARNNLASARSRSF
jgi:hypothetical protein